jgi:hypothetical protein
MPVTKLTFYYLIISGVDMIEGPWLADLSSFVHLAVIRLLQYVILIQV